ncbi:death-associated protein kinase 1 [Elysia marginata]|uniref:Death-associated protein kinase 1 n=1 Tax=Elysia marginata TaxID=1093978 RepID=A0AAV4F3A8_9GAST|nr:death-associated protein kinase 1 [Elysia marginata]
MAMYTSVLNLAEDKAENFVMAALFCASEEGNVDGLRELSEMAANIDLNTANKHGETAVHMAASGGHVEVLKFLVSKGVDISIRDKQGDSAVYWAARQGHTEIIRCLVDAGVPINTQNKSGETALHVAARYGHTVTVEYLCSIDANINLFDNLGETPLHCASWHGYVQIVRTLCENGAMLSLQNKETGEGALHSAAREGLLTVVQTMCSLGVEIESKTTDGFTALHLACKYGHIEVARSLLFVGADPDVVNVVSIFSRSKLSRQFSLPTPLNYSVGNPAYTKGIEVQAVNISGAGDFSVWEFSGYEPYYMLYDHFLGDTSCVHCVLFNLEDSLDEQMAEVVFWLNFLKARIHPKMPIGPCGKLQNTAHVILVATHADKAETACSKNSSGSHTSADASYILEKVTTMFQYDLDICQEVFVMDAQLPTSHDLRMLKQQLGKLKKEISEKLPRTNGFVTAVVGQLPEWRRTLQAYPVLGWPQFCEQVRSCVNPLASDEDVKLLDRQLQFMGEVVYLHSHSTDLVVLNPRWLGVDVLGSLMSHEQIAQARLTGCFSLDEFQLLFPTSDSMNLLQVLEALEMCTPCEVDGDIEYEFPCLNFVETLEGLWLRDDKRFPSPIYGGVRLHTSFQSGAQLKYLFPRIQVFLRRSILSGDEEEEDANCHSEDDISRTNNNKPVLASDLTNGTTSSSKDADLYQWHHGSKYCCARLEGIIDMDRNEQYLEIKVRGPKGSERANLYYFLEDFVSIIEQVVESVCPGLCVERYTLSPSQLREHGKVVRSYSPTELLRMQLDNRSSVVLSGLQREDFIDIACLGSEEILESVTLGMELPISHLTVHTQRLLSLLLDPPEAMGKDWCLLAVILGLSDVLPALEESAKDEEKAEQEVSHTQKVLNEWTRVHPNANIRELVCKLKEIGRLDAVEAILRTGPPFKVLSFEDQLTEASSGGTHGTNASSNTLSNLSR